MTPPAPAMSEISELIERLEKATGPDREIDCAIKELLDPRYKPKDRVIYYGEATGEHVGEDGQFYKAPAYTASLDAALMLVPEDHPWAVGDLNEDDFPWACVTNQHTVDFNGNGSTPAVSMCIAALKARARTP